MAEDATADLQERFVGNRYYNRSIDESFTVVDVQPPLVLLQYDDGTAWDEACAPDMFMPSMADMVGVSEGGIDDAQYEPLPGGGPTLADACDDGNHRFSPRPEKLGLDDPDRWRASEDGTLVSDTYHTTVRCKRCGLSGSVLMEFLGHAVPEVCDRCGSGLVPEENEMYHSPSPDWQDETLCGECTEVVRTEYESYAVACYRCEDPLGSNLDNHSIAPSSMVGKKLGADEDDVDEFYLCNGCRATVVGEFDD